MKKLLTSLATIALIAGSVANAAAWSKINHQQNATDLTKPAKSNLGAESETAQQIANKLEDKTVTLDFPAWANNFFGFHSPQFRKALVEQGLLTADEAQYVYLSYLNADKPKVYQVSNIYVAEKGKPIVYVKNVNIDLTTTDTLQQIANKIDENTIDLNSDYWKNKSIRQYFSEIRQIIINDKILTKAEAQLLYGVVNDKTIPGPGTFTSQFQIGDGFETVVANANIDVVDTGLSAQEIADKLESKVIRLSGLSWDGKNIRANKQSFEGELVKQNILPRADLQYLSYPDVTINHAINYHLNINVSKNGQTAVATDVKLNVYRNEDILSAWRQPSTTVYDLQARVANSTPEATKLYQNWPGINGFNNFMTGIGPSPWYFGTLFGDFLDNATYEIGGGRNIRNEFKEKLHYINPVKLHDLLNDKTNPYGLYLKFFIPVNGSLQTDKLTVAEQP